MRHFGFIRQQLTEIRKMNIVPRRFTAADSSDMSFKITFNHADKISTSFSNGGQTKQKQKTYLPGKFTSI
jgi:hypothetical protein